MHPLTKLIKNDMKPALGVTEPGAIAFAVAKAKEYIQKPVTKVQVRLNSGMYKNAFTCGIPNSDKMGNVYAAALGVVAGDASLFLEALSKVSEQDNRLAEVYVKQGMVEVELDHMGAEIFIEATVFSAVEKAMVKIEGSHTHIVEIWENENLIYQQGKAVHENENGQHIHGYSLEELLEYVNRIPLKEICFIKEAFQMNMELFQAAVNAEQTSFVKAVKQRGEDNNAKDQARLLCCGAIEGRVLGLAKPAMSITGSGAHGIIATLPLYGYREAKKQEISEETLLRGTAFGFLVTMYIKEYSGKLSAFCGCAIAAGTGMACGLAYLQGEGKETIDRIIWNMASSITGMICDGGNQGCVMKALVAVDAAFLSVDMAVLGVYIDKIHGINGKTAEETMRNMGRIASPGMVATEQVIVDIMKG